MEKKAALTGLFFVMQPTATDINTGIYLLMACTGVPFIAGVLVGARLALVYYQSGLAGFVPGPIKKLYEELTQDD